MKVFRTKSDVKAFVTSAKKEGKSIGFTPTMGALHSGHLEMIRRCVEENAVAVVSLFVNPIQFNNKEDLDKYPRTENVDLALLESVGCSAVFVPSVDEMYPQEVTETYDLSTLADVMEGACRPGHFNGVAVVCCRLFDIVEPDRAYFGEKDFQQLSIIRHVVSSLGLDMEIMSHPIVRDNTGLAMSSRNARLTKEELAVAPFLNQVLMVGNRLACLGKSVIEIKDACEKLITLNPYFELDYLEIADEKTLRRAENICNARIFVAAYIGGVRLIDNKKIG